jgi:hypothetical protein
MGPSTMTGSAVGEKVKGFGVPVERFALAEDRGGAGVEVLRAGVVVVGLGGIAAPDDSEDRPSVGVVGSRMGMTSRSRKKSRY